MTLEHEKPMPFLKFFIVFDYKSDFSFSILEYNYEFIEK